MRGKSRRGQASNQPPRRPSTDDETVPERVPAFTVGLPVQLMEDRRAGVVTPVHVAAEIEGMTDASGVYRGGMRTVARRLGASDGTVSEHFRSLQQLGYLRYYGRAGGWVLRWNQWRAVATDEIYEWDEDLVGLDDAGDQRELNLPIGIDDPDELEVAGEPEPWTEATEEELAAMTAYERRVYEFTKRTRIPQ